MQNVIFGYESWLLSGAITREIVDRERWSFRLPLYRAAVESRQ